MKLHLKLHLNFIYAFIPQFYSIACLSKLHSIITSLMAPNKNKAILVFLTGKDFEINGHEIIQYAITKPTVK